MEESIEKTYRAVQKRIQRAAVRAGRKSGGILLVAVSKQQPMDSIRELYRLGVRDFGESRVQEMLWKRDALPPDIRWHLVGHLQSNKAKDVAPFVHMVHSIHSIGLAKELSKRAGEVDREIEVLIEVNISGEPQKQGVDAANTEALALEIERQCPNLRISGLMGMASLEEDPERTRPQFQSLRKLLEEIQERQPQLESFTKLSMGMSNDFEIAIEGGATIVRIGSALFSGNE